MCLHLVWNRAKRRAQQERPVKKEGREVRNWTNIKWVIHVLCHCYVVFCCTRQIWRTAIFWTLFWLDWLFFDETNKNVLRALNGLHLILEVVYIGYYLKLTDFRCGDHTRDICLSHSSWWSAHTNTKCIVCSSVGCLIDISTFVYIGVGCTQVKMASSTCLIYSIPGCIEYILAWSHHATGCKYCVVLCGARDMGCQEYCHFWNIGVEFEIVSNALISYWRLLNWLYSFGVEEVEGVNSVMSSKTQPWYVNNGISTIHVVSDGRTFSLSFYW